MDQLRHAKAHDPVVYVGHIPKWFTDYLNTALASVGLDKTCKEATDITVSSWHPGKLLLEFEFFVYRSIEVNPYKFAPVKITVENEDHLRYLNLHEFSAAELTIDSTTVAKLASFTTVPWGRKFPDSCGCEYNWHKQSFRWKTCYISMEIAREVADVAVIGGPPARIDLDKYTLSIESDLHIAADNPLAMPAMTGVSLVKEKEECES